MKRRFTILTAALALLAFLALPMGMRGQAPVGTTLWAEDFSGFANNVDPSGEYTNSHTGTTVYGGVTITYSKTNGGGTTQTYTSGGPNSNNNLLIAKSNGSFTISGISTGEATELTVSYAKSGSGVIAISTSTTGVTVDGSTSGSTITTNGASTIAITFTNTGSSNLRIDDIEISVKTAGSSGNLEDSDLALVDAPVELEFDLYDNANAQTISYTTSSTGEVTVSQSDYITTTVNANNTITVTPVAVTNGPQTITINQAADDTYQAGSVTFTVDIEDSTPTTGSDVTFDATVDKDLNNTTQGQGSIVKNGVTFTCSDGILGNGTEYRLYKNSTTTFSVESGTITQIVFTCTSGNPASGFSTQTGWTTNGSNGTWTGNATSVSFVASSKQVRATTIVVTVETSSTSNPTISADDVNIAYDAEEGTITYTINNPVEGGSIVASCDAEWIEVDDTPQTDAEGSIDFICAPNSNFYAHSATVTLTYTYGNSKATVTKDITVTQALDPDANGSTIDYPIMVSEAIEAIDEVGTVSNIYVGGIVSNIETEYSSQHQNITFDMIDEEGNEYFLRAYRCGGNEAANVMVGDEVIVYGNLIKYDEIYEFAQDCQLVSLTHPTYPIINASDVNLTYDATSGSIAYSITNPTGATLTATSTADWISNIIVGSESVTFTTTANEGNEDRSATITLSYEGAADKAITVTQAHYVPDYATLPFEYDGNALAANLVPGLTQNGITDSYNTTPKIKFDTQGDYVILKINERPGILTFDIKGNGFSGGTFKVQTSEDGTSYTDLATYTSDNLGSTVQSQEFYNLGAGVRYIKWIYTTRSSGNVALGKIALAKYVAPQQYDLTVSLSDNVSAIFVYDANNQNNPLIAGGAAGTVQVDERTSIMISPVVAEGCALTSLMVNGVNVINQLDESGAYTFTMPSQDVAISATAMATTTYTLATTIESGRHYIITNGNDRAMGAQNDNNRAAVEIYISLNDVAQVTSPDVFEFVINGPDANGFYTIYDANIPGYLYAASNSSNHLKTETHLDSNKNGNWTITFDDENHNAVITAKGNNSHNLMRYNNGSNVFSCYASGQDPIYLYVKDETTPQYDFYKDIAKHTETSGWNFIASPVGNAPTNMNALSDLYFYDEDDSYWRNKDVAANAAGFNFAIGNGYLAASNDNITLSFSGSSIITAETYQIPLAYSGETNPLAGWNLVGNPYPHRAYANKPYYIIITDGMQLNTTAQTTDVPVDFCAGIMVKATGNGESVTFRKTPADNLPNQLQLTVAQQVVTRSGVNSMVNDNAIINFNEGSQLEKFTFNADAAKLYIPQNGKEYAIVSTQANGEMPVSFKASENGSYTLTVSPENVEMNYLHLIDNMTGMDVDLLANPSYTFDATTRDYESRFRLVFGANNENGTSTGTTTFAYYNGSEWVIANDGTATLQVVDMMGRIVSTQTVNGNTSLSTNGMSTGVYVMRLVNGNEVKTQKIVVK